MIDSPFCSVCRLNAVERMQKGDCSFLWCRNCGTLPGVSLGPTNTPRITLAFRPLLDYIGEVVSGTASRIEQSIAHNVAQEVRREIANAVAGYDVDED